MAWEIEYTDQFEQWWEQLSGDEQEALNARVTLLAVRGPSLKRPVVGEIRGSDFDPRMKEIVCEEGTASLRVLFIFDARRTALLLLGGDKTGQWSQWYRTAIPQADNLYRTHLAELENEGS